MASLFCAETGDMGTLYLIEMFLSHKFAQKGWTGY